MHFFLLLQVLNKKLNTACDNVDQKTNCKKFIEKNRRLLIKELETNDDVETICKRSSACK